MTRRSVVAVGTVVEPRELVTVNGVSVPIPDPHTRVHLQFRRFAGCPICNVHLQSVVRRHDEITAAGLREVAVFHSTPQELAGHAVDLPFAMVADPDKVLYAEFGVGKSARAVLDPRAMAPVLGPMIRGLSAIGGTHGATPPANLHPTGGRLGLPADFLIDSDGRVLACKHGIHAYDQWSVDELLAHAQ